MNRSGRPNLWGLLLAAMLLACGAWADQLTVGKDFIPLSKDKPYIYVIHDGRSIRVQRVQDPDYQLKGYFARTARKCPPFCLQPVSPAPGVQTIGEVELFDFMETELRDGTGLLVDARTPAWHKRGTIPGSINIAFTHLTKTDDAPEMLEALELFGAKEREEPGLVDRWMDRLGLSEAPDVTGKWDFSQAKNLVLWCNGPECGQSPRAIRGLLKVGYPADKIRYYRGGMQIWQLWGLTTVVPND